MTAKMIVQIDIPEGKNSDLEKIMEFVNSTLDLAEWDILEEEIGAEVFGWSVSEEES